MNASDVKKTLSSLTAEQIEALGKVIIASASSVNKNETPKVTLDNVENNNGSTGDDNTSNMSTCDSSTPNESTCNENARRSLPSDNPVTGLTEDKLHNNDCDELKILENITEKLNKANKIRKQLGADSGGNVLQWLTKMEDELGIQLKDLEKQKKEAKKYFMNCMKTLNEMFQVLLNCKNSKKGTYGDFIHLISPPIQPLMRSFISNKIQNDDQFYNETHPLSEFNQLIETDVMTVQKLVKDAISEICTKIQKFYLVLESVDEYPEIPFLNLLPTKDELDRFLGAEKASEIGDQMSKKLSKIGPEILDKLDAETQKIEIVKSQRLEQIRQLQRQLWGLQNELSIEDGKINLDEYSEDEQIISKVGLKMNTITKYKSEVEKLQKVRDARQKMLDGYMNKLSSLWDILRPGDQSIVAFLKQNKNLKESSILNLESLIKKLEQEKKDNIAKFIKGCRDRIRGYWELLMYDEDEKKKFTQFFVTDTSMFTEELLDMHTKEVEKLRVEAESIKPLLKSIADLDQLLEDKKELDEASRDPSRLLRRDSFRILRREEKMRSKLTKQLPSTIERIKQKLHEFEMKGHRQFKINGEPYIKKLAEIERATFYRHRKFNRSSFKQRRQQSSRSSGSRRESIPGTRRNRRLTLDRTAVRSCNATPSTSVSRSRSASSMSNPFVSREASPTVRSRVLSSSGARLNRTRSLGTVGSEPLRALHFNPLNDGRSTVSNTPIVIKGGSPIRQLDYSTARTLSTKKSILSHVPKLRSLSPGNGNTFNSHSTSSPKFRYPTSDRHPLGNSSFLNTNNGPDTTGRKRKASYQLQKSELNDDDDDDSLEDLSDSLIYMSDSERFPVCIDKENQPPLDCTQKTKDSKSMHPAGESTSPRMTVN